MTAAQIVRPSDTESERMTKTRLRVRGPRRVTALEQKIIPTAYPHDISGTVKL